MRLPAAAFLAALWLAGVGLATVYMEVENVRAGVRIRKLLEEETARIERLRLLDLRQHRLLSPDQLEQSLPPEFRSRWPAAAN
jgi:hypothetical protein